MLAAPILAAILSIASPSLTLGPEVVLDSFFRRYPTPLSIGGTRDALVVAGTTFAGTSDPQAFYRIVDGAPRDRVLLTGRSEGPQVVTNGAETLVAWGDPTGTQVLFPFHPNAVTHHVDNGIFFFAMPTPDGFRVFAHDRFFDVSSVAIAADGSSIGPSIDLLYAAPPAVQSRGYFVFLGGLPTNGVLNFAQPALFATPDQHDFEVIATLSVNRPGDPAAVASKGDSAVFLMQDLRGLATWAVDLTGQPRVTSSHRLFDSVPVLASLSLAWTGTNYVVVWAERAGDGTRSVRGLLLDDDGEAAGAPFTIAENAEAPAVTGLGRGEAAVVYATLDEVPPRLVLRRLSPPLPPHRRAVR